MLAEGRTDRVVVTPRPPTLCHFTMVYNSCPHGIAHDESHCCITPLHSFFYSYQSATLHLRFNSNPLNPPNAFDGTGSWIEFAEDMAAWLDHERPHARKLLHWAGKVKQEISDLDLDLSDIAGVTSAETDGFVPGAR